MMLQVNLDSKKFQHELKVRNKEMPQVNVNFMEMKPKTTSKNIK